MALSWIPLGTLILHPPLLNLAYKCHYTYRYNVCTLYINLQNGETVWYSGGERAGMWVELDGRLREIEPRLLEGIDASPISVLEGRFYIDIYARNKEFSYDKSQID